MCTFKTTTSTAIAICLGVGLLASPVNQSATATDTETSPPEQQLGPPPDGPAGPLVDDLQSDLPIMDSVTKPRPCPGDLDGDGVIGFGDMLCVLCAWGPCPTDSCPEDLNGNGQVGFDDFFRVVCGYGLTCDEMAGSG
ncbi:MAG: hypothetical protein GY715_05630 [Planctomycetes bacterium]|nr:hypothetical protein [Planctomycetota bacterium]